MVDHRLWRPAGGEQADEDEYHQAGNAGLDRSGNLGCDEQTAGTGDRKNFDLARVVQLDDLSVAGAISIEICPPTVCTWRIGVGIS